MLSTESLKHVADGWQLTGLRRWQTLNSTWMVKFRFHLTCTRPRHASDFCESLHASRKKYNSKSSWPINTAAVDRMCVGRTAAWPVELAHRNSQVHHHWRHTSCCNLTLHAVILSAAITAAKKQQLNHRRQEAVKKPMSKIDERQKGAEFSRASIFHTT